VESRHAREAAETSKATFAVSTPSLAKILLRCLVIIFGFAPSIMAIALLFLPSVIQDRTSDLMFVA
jgi:hypothetical protein